MIVTWLICSCGCDRFIEMRRIITRGKTAMFLTVFKCEGCGKEATS